MGDGQFDLQSQRSRVFAFFRGNCRPFCAGGLAVQRKSTGVVFGRRHAEVSEYEGMAGVAGEKLANGSIPVALGMFSRAEGMRIDRCPGRFPKGIERRASKAEIGDVTSA